MKRNVYFTNNELFSWLRSTCTPSHPSQCTSTGQYSACAIVYYLNRISHRSNHIARVPVIAFLGAKLPLQITLSVRPYIRWSIMYYFRFGLTKTVVIDVEETLSFSEFFLAPLGLYFRSATLSLAFGKRDLLNAYSQGSAMHRTMQETNEYRHPRGHTHTHTRTYTHACACACQRTLFFYLLQSLISFV